MTDLFRLDGHAAIVTGGGRGLGRRFALALAGAGADVVVIARREDDLAETVRLVGEAGREAVAVPGDVVDGAVADEAVATCLERFGRLDVLVNNAGLYHMQPLEETPPEDWQRVLDVNLMGTFHFCRAAAKTFKDAKRGKVINIASILAHKGVPEATAYCTAKGGVVLLTRALGAEWAPHGINVNAIAPGLFNTDMSRVVFENDDFYEQVMSGIPLGKHGEPEDLDGTLLYLASRASDHMVGQVLHVDGGSSIA